MLAPVLALVPIPLGKILGPFQSWPVVSVVLLYLPLHPSVLAVISVSGGFWFLFPLSSGSLVLSMCHLFRVLFFYRHARFTLLLQVPELFCSGKEDSASSLGPLKNMIWSHIWSSDAYSVRDGD